MQQQSIVIWHRQSASDRQDQSLAAPALNQLLERFSLQLPKTILTQLSKYFTYFHLNMRFDHITRTAELQGQTLTQSRTNPAFTRPGQAYEDDSGRFAWAHTIVRRVHDRLVDSRRSSHGRRFQPGCVRLGRRQLGSLHALHQNLLLGVLELIVSIAQLGVESQSSPEGADALAILLFMQACYSKTVV